MLIEETARKIEKAISVFDFELAESMMLPEARWIEHGPPVPVNDWGGFPQLKKAGVRIDYELSDFKIEVDGDVAWLTLLIKGRFTGDSPEARALVGTVANPLSERNQTFVESFVMKRTASGWKLALGHTSAIDQ